MNHVIPGYESNDRWLFESFIEKGGFTCPFRVIDRYTANGYMLEPAGHGEFCIIVAWSSNVRVTTEPYTVDTLDLAIDKARVMARNMILTLPQYRVTPDPHTDPRCEIDPRFGWKLNGEYVTFETINILQMDPLFLAHPEPKPEDFGPTPSSNVPTIPIQMTNAQTDDIFGFANL